MRKLIIAIVVIALAGFGIYKLNQRPYEVPDFGSSTTENGEFKPDPSNATFIFEDGPITLSKGRSEHSVGGGLIEEIELTDLTTYGDINGDGREDTAVLIARLGGGSGQFFYIAGFVSAGSSFKGTNAVYVGDRISPQSLAIEGGVITLKFLDRSAEEPFAASPTIPTSKSFVIRSGTLMER